MPFTFDQLRGGLERAEFVPYFQPVVDLRSGNLHGFEVLARWERPHDGVIGPSVFIPCLERHGLINDLTATLLIQAFAAVRRVPGEFRLAVNFSPSQLHDPKLAALVELIAEISEFDLRRLTIELTETALVADLDLARSVATDLKQLGIRLALDDFGTGYSSMLHLQSLPLDELKVDRSFVQSMLETRESRKITAGVISLGLSLDLQTVAEGIEDPSQVDLLVCQGCHLGQGFLFSRPVPASELAALCSRRFAAGQSLRASVADPLLAFDAHPAERLAQLRAIYDGAPVALAFLDKQLRYVNLNQRLADLNGRSIHDHLGRKVSEILPAQIYTQVEHYLLRALEGESFPSVQVRTHRPQHGGPATYGMVSFQPVRDEAGEIVGVSVAISDITSLKQAEEALRESEDHYRHTVELNPQLPRGCGRHRQHHHGQLQMGQVHRTYARGDEQSRMAEAGAPGGR
jgi:PAS domain S-box-containing protein